MALRLLHKGKIHKDIKLISIRKEVKYIVYSFII